LCDAGLGVDVVWVLGDVVVRDRKSSHRQSHACRTEEHKRTAADLLDNEDWDERRHEVLCAVACGKELGVVVLSETDSCVERGGIVTVFIVSACSEIFQWGVVRNQVDTRDLLVHLVDVGEDNSVEFAIFGHLEQAAVRALGHFNDGLLHIVELGDDVRVVAVQVVDVFQDFESFFFPALHDEPTGALGQVQDHAENDQTEEDLEG
jgi:hypothetical protein